MRQYAYRIILLLLFIISSITVRAQLQGTEEILQDLFLRIPETRNDSARIRINDSINRIIGNYVTSDVIFRHKFENLRYLGQIPSPDSRIKIVTWNLILTDGTNRYFCYLIKKGEHGGENRIFRLTGVNMDEAPRTDINYSADNWYGALYYAIQPFRMGKETSYILLGLDYGSLLVSRKIIDVLSFTNEGEIIFGKRCFQREDVTKSREVFEYSADGVMTLRFNGRKRIVFDHLASISTDRKYSPESYGTEFSFDAYIFKKGMWRFIKSVDVRNKL
jgi:hypothetical protein